MVGGSTRPRGRSGKWEWEESAPVIPVSLSPHSRAPVRRVPSAPSSSLPLFHFLSVVINRPYRPGRLCPAAYREPQNAFNIHIGVNRPRATLLQLAQPQGEGSWHRPGTGAVPRATLSSHGRRHPCPTVLQQHAILRPTLHYTAMRYADHAEHPSSITTYQHAVLRSCRLFLPYQDILACNTELMQSIPALSRHALLQICRTPHTPQRQGGVASM